jgi:hypothetical protein
MTMSSADTPPPSDGSAEGPLVDAHAAFRGALVGLAVLVVVSVVQAILDHNLDDLKDTGWVYPLFVGILLGYALAGFSAGRDAPDGALTNGTIAGVGAFVLWIPVRIVIWLVRDEHKGLFTGHSPALRPGQLFGQLVLAAGVGMLGGYLASRSAARYGGTSS